MMRQSFWGQIRAETFSGIFTFLFYLVPLVSLAQVTAPVVASTAAGLINKLCLLINWIFASLMVVAVLFVIIAAYRYVTASGEPDKISNAHSRLLYAAIAVIVAIAAKSVPLVLANILVPGENVLACWSFSPVPPPPPGGPGIPV